MALNRLSMIRQVWKKLHEGKGFDNYLSSLVITDATENVLRTKVTVSKKLCNNSGILHGGATASIADVVSTLCVLSSTGDKHSVSVNFSINYLKGVKAGDEITVNAEAVKIGKTMAYLDTTVFNSAGDIIATINQVNQIVPQ